jgi:prepilin-type N-terminal cleavage/methylation domain-containing protein
MPGDARFTVHLLDVSRGGLAVFSSRFLRPGQAVELSLPCEDRDTGSLHGWVTYTRVESDGNVLGISFAQSLTTDQLQKNLKGSSQPPRRRGFSLLEALVVVTVMGVLVSLAAPTFTRAVEQSRADIATSNLRAVWSAQRVYWLEYRAYAGDLPTLTSVGLLDSAITSASTYNYTITSANESSFTATATRAGSVRWTGQFQIDQTGALSGVIHASGEPDIVPAFQ